MPRYEVRLEAQDAFREDGSPHYRLTRLVADNEQSARRHCERQEFATCAYQLPDDDLKRIEAIEASPKQTLDGQDKGRLFAHRQSTPYLVVSVTEVPERKGG